MLHVYSYSRCIHCGRNYIDWNSPRFCHPDDVRSKRVRDCVAQAARGALLAAAGLVAIGAMLGWQ